MITTDLSGQVALVTGASRGIGKAVALAFARCGAKVACVARSLDKLNETVSEIRAAGGIAEPFACDVANRESVDAVVEAVVEKWETVHILVNNAGITRDTLVPRMSDAHWDDVINTNLRGAFLFIRAVTRSLMQNRYGRIINMSSVSALTGNMGQANYAASKAGLIGLTRTVAKELASRNVTANAIAPGFIATDMTAALGDALTDEVKKRVPAKRLGTPEDVAAAALFLASRDAGYITGLVLTVDGGMTA